MLPKGEFDPALPPSPVQVAIRQACGLTFSSGPIHMGRTEDSQQHLSNKTGESHGPVKTGRNQTAPHYRAADTPRQVCAALRRP